MKARISLLVPLIVVAVALAEAAVPPPEPPREAIPVLLLGTFHFKDAGLDSYQPEHDVDVLSEERQREVEEVVRCLAAFRPTRIAVEAMPEEAEKLRSELERYRAGDFELPANEIYQLGFRLAGRLGLERVHPIDAGARWYEPFVDPTEYAQRTGQATALIASEGPWEVFYESLYAHQDERKTRQSLRAELFAINGEDEILLSHGHYLIGTFKVAQGDEYPGADAKTGWYNRNLRIFANLQRVISAPEDRVLVIIGAGHLPILRHAVEASPELELDEARFYLGPGCGEAASDRSPSPATKEHPLSFLLGEWCGEGETNGAPSSQRMSWDSVLGGKFVRIHLHNRIGNPGRQLELEGVGYYRQTSDGRLSGTWADSLGYIHPISAELRGQDLDATWGSAQTKLGRSVYRLAGGELVVEDYVRKGDDWARFGRAALRRCQRASDPAASEGPGR